jgi:hypothetical protein
MAQTSRRKSFAPKSMRRAHQKNVSTHGKNYAESETKLEKNVTRKKQVKLTRRLT